MNATALIRCASACRTALGACALAVYAALPASTSYARVAAPVDGFWTAQARAMTVSAGWALNGLAAGAALRLAPSARPLICSNADADGRVVGYDAAVGLCAGRDRLQAGAVSYYNGGPFHYGTVVSPARTGVPFDHAVLSWVARTPPGTWVEAHLRVRLSTGIWTRWYDFPIWATGTETVYRHSVDGQGGLATVETDTLALRRGYTAAGYQLAATLFSAGSLAAATPLASPTLFRLSLATSRARVAIAPATNQAAWGIDLSIPPRSQMLYGGGSYGGGGEAWCSPTSTSMILAYWAHTLHRPDLDESVPAAARGVYDWSYGGAGNWPFNVAHAAALAGMDGYVARFPSLAAVEPWIRAGVPLAISVAFAPGALPGSPIAATAGHLLVLRGFDRAGNPVVNDPAAPADATVRRVYPRAALQRAWLVGSSGTAYMIFPVGWRVPAMTSA